MKQRFFPACTVFLSVVISLAGACMYAQVSSMRLATEAIDFGDVASVKYPAKTVEFTNISKEKLAILVVEKSPSVKVGYEPRFFEPGEKGLISFFYEAGTLGPFNEEVRIFTNLDDSPYVVALKGNCIAVEACFPDKANLNLRKIVVVNKYTQAPVPFAGITFVHNFNNARPILCKTDRDGKAVKELPTGQYNAQCAVAGYEILNLDFFLPRSQPVVFLELIPLQSIPEEAVAVVAVVKEDAGKHDSTETGMVTVTSTDLPEDRYAANNVVLLLDVSSSMRAGGKFTLLKQSVNNLVMVLRSIDNVSVITYAGDAKTVIRGVPGSEKEKITGMVSALQAEGITRGVKGLQTAYGLASEKFIAGGNNQIILATDGEFSEKNLTDEYYREFISGYAAKGIRLSILGFGVNEEAANRMKMMTASGEGSYIHVESEKYVRDVLINEIKKMSFIGQ